MSDFRLKVAVFSTKREKARGKMQELVKESGELILKQTMDLIITDKSEFRCYLALESSRGARFHKVYVDVDTSIRVLNMVIKPSLRNPVLDYETGEHLYPRDEYKVNEHIHYF